MSVTQIKFNLYSNYTHMILYFFYIYLLTRKCTFDLSLVSSQVPYLVNVALCVRIPHVAFSFDEVWKEVVGALFVKLVFFARRVHLFVSA